MIFPDFSLTFPVRQAKIHHTSIHCSATVVASRYSEENVKWKTVYIASTNTDMLMFILSLIIFLSFPRLFSFSSLSFRDHFGIPDFARFSRWVVIFSSCGWNSRQPLVGLRSITQVSVHGAISVCCSVNHLFVVAGGPHNIVW